MPAFSPKGLNIVGRRDVPESRKGQASQNKAMSDLKKTQINSTITYTGQKTES